MSPPYPPIPPSSNQPSTNARWKLVETAPASALLGEPIQGWAQAPRGPHPPPAGGQHAFSWAVLRVGCPSCDTVGCCPAPCSPLTGRVWDSLQRGDVTVTTDIPKATVFWDLTFPIVIMSYYYHLPYGKRGTRGREDADTGCPSTWPPWPRQGRDGPLPGVAAVWG